MFFLNLPVFSQPDGVNTLHFKHLCPIWRWGWVKTLSSKWACPWVVRSQDDWTPSEVLKRRGILLPAFEIHGGAKGLYDFDLWGPSTHWVNQSWLNHCHHWQHRWTFMPDSNSIRSLGGIRPCWEFSDFMTVCTSCDEASRADTLLEGHHPNPDSLSKSELQSLLNSVQPACPSCSAAEWSEITAENLMFNTTIGAGKPSWFFTPWNCSRMFTSFPALYRIIANVLFGAKKGKGYRNEISPVKEWFAWGNSTWLNWIFHQSSWARRAWFLTVEWDFRSFGRRNHKELHSLLVRLWRMVSFVIQLLDIMAQTYDFQEHWNRCWHVCDSVSMSPMRWLTMLRIVGMQNFSAPTVGLNASV